MSTRSRLLIVSLLVIGSLGAIGALEPEVFAPYIGDLPPLLVALLVCALGAFAITHLERRAGFTFFDPSIPRRARLKPLLWSVPFMVAVTIADLWLGFPADINVAPPTAWLFYPAIGYVAQLALHVVPLALLLTAAKAMRFSSQAATVWVAILLASSIEAAFQVWASLAGGSFDALGVFVALHLFCFGVTELHLYRRFDFAAMYAFRLAYYAYWHLLWSVLRLQ